MCRSKRTFKRILAYVLSIVMLLGLNAVAPVSTVEASDIDTVSKKLRATEMMEDVISNYKYLDYKTIARELDRVLFEFADNPEYVSTNTDTYAPIGYWDDTHVNIDERMFGLPSYVGHVNSNGEGTISPGTQEGITTIAAVLGRVLKKYRFLG